MHPKQGWLASLGFTPTYADSESVVYAAPNSGPRQPVSLLVVGDERIFETRTYRILPPGFGEEEAHTMKILAKSRPDGRLWWVMKLENAQGRTYQEAYGANNGWQSEAAYRDAVARCEGVLDAVALLAQPVVTTGAELEAKLEAAHMRDRRG